MKRRYSETGSQGIKEELEQYMSSTPCAACHGYRLKPESLAVTDRRAEHLQVTAYSIEERLRWQETLELTEREQTSPARS